MYLEISCGFQGGKCTSRDNIEGWLVGRLSKNHSRKKGKNIMAFRPTKMV